MSTVGVPVGEPDVYFISGHGGEGAGTFQVPAKNLVVVKMNTCKSASAHDFYNDFEEIVKMDMSLLLEPDVPNAKSALRDKIRTSFKIYRPEDEEECPNFQYSLLNVHRNGDDILVDTNVGSGVISISRVKEHRKAYPIITMSEQFYTIHRSDTSIRRHDSIIHRNDTNKHPNNPYTTKEEFINYIVKLYRYSVFPGMEFIKYYLTNRWKSKENVTPYEMIEDLTMQRYPPFYVTQKDLCMAQGSEGVFYHNVCRTASPNANDYLKKITSFENPNGERPKIGEMIQNPYFQRKLIESLNRARTEKIYQDSKYARNRRYQSALQNCKELEERLEKITKEENKIINMGYSANEEERQLKNIEKTKRPGALARALELARKNCIRYRKINIDTPQNRERGRNTRNTNRNRNRNRNRSRSPIRQGRGGGKNKTHRKRR